MKASLTRSVFNLFTFKETDMKHALIHSFLFLAVLAILGLAFAQVEPAAAQTIGEGDPPVFVTDLDCQIVVSTDPDGRNVIPSNYSGYVEELYIRFYVINKGPVATAQTFAVSSNVTLNGGSIASKNLPFYGPLAAGEVKEWTPVYVKLGAPLTSLRASIVVDRENVIPETNEGLDNYCTFNYTHFSLFP